MPDGNENSSKLLFGLNNKELGFLVVRLGMGINLLFHGLVRIPNLAGFVGGMQTKFAESMLPMFLVTPMANAIPFAELLLGLLLLLGIATRYALLGTAVQMAVLITGSCFLQEWGPINSQMFLLALAAFLIANLDLNRCAISKSK